MPRMNLDNIVDELCCAYLLPRAIVLRTVEEEIEAQLSGWYRGHVNMYWTGQNDHQLTAHLLLMRPVGGIWEEKELIAPKIKGWNHIRRRIEKILSQREASWGAKVRQPLVGTVQQGEIIKRHQSGDLYVEIKDQDNTPFIGVCPPDLMGPHEREWFGMNTGHKRYFHIHTVEPVALAGAYRIKITLGRLSNRLPINLLRQRVPIEYRGKSLYLACPRRIAGVRSEIVSSWQFNRKDLQVVTEELGGEFLKFTHRPNKPSEKAE